LNREKHISALQKIEGKLAKPKLFRWLCKPFGYLKIKRQHVSSIEFCKTYFGHKMFVQLPASGEIVLYGCKVHDSEIRLSYFLANNVTSNEVFFDIGAHYGFFTLLVQDLMESTKDGYTLSFEPSPKTFEILEKNIEEFNNRIIRNAAVGLKVGNTKFYQFENGLYSENNSLDPSTFKNKNWFKKENASAVNIAITTIDELAKEKLPTLIKIDVEGGELDVLKGGESTLKNNSNVTVVMEYWNSKFMDNSNHQKAVDFMLNLGYKSYKIEAKGTLQVITNVEEHAIATGLESDNIVFKK